MGVAADVILTHCAEINLTHLGDDGRFLVPYVEPGASSGSSFIGLAGDGDSVDRGKQSCRPTRFDDTRDRRR